MAATMCSANWSLSDGSFSDAPRASPSAWPFRRERQRQAATNYASVLSRLTALEGQLQSVGSRRTLCDIQSQVDELTSRIDILEKVFILVDWQRLEAFADEKLGSFADTSPPGLELKRCAERVSYDMAAGECNFPDVPLFPFNTCRNDNDKAMSYGKRDVVQGPFSVQDALPVCAQSVEPLEHAIDFEQFDGETLPGDQVVQVVSASSSGGAQVSPEIGVEAHAGFSVGSRCEAVSDYQGVKNVEFIGKKNARFAADTILLGACEDMLQRPLAGTRTIADCPVAENDCVSDTKMTCDLDAGIVSPATPGEYVASVLGATSAVVPPPVLCSARALDQFLTELDVRSEARATRQAHTVTEMNSQSDACAEMQAKQFQLDLRRTFGFSQSGSDT